MYLAAVSPSVDEVRYQVAFLDEKEEIEKASFEDFDETKPAILKIQAKERGLSLSDYKENLLIPIKEKALKELEEKYGFKIDSSRSDPREAVRQKYQKIQEKQQGISEMVEKSKLDKVKRVSQLFEMPENLDNLENK